MSYIRASSGGKVAADAARDRAVDNLARAANVSPDEPRIRLQHAKQQARAAADRVKQAAQAAAEATRKGVAGAGILGFVALVLGAVAAWFGGGIGVPCQSARIVPCVPRRLTGGPVGSGGMHSHAAAFVGAARSA